MQDKFDRRRFIQQATAIGGIVGTSRAGAFRDVRVDYEGDKLLCRNPWSTHQSSV